MTADEIQELEIVDPGALAQRQVLSHGRGKLNLRYDADVMVPITYINKDPQSRHFTAPAVHSTADGAFFWSPTS